MNAAVYIRKSREDKSKPAHRLTLQREQLPEYARSQGWTPVIYDDGYASAARGKVEDLPERGRLENDIRKGRVGVILVIELSRLSRDDSMQDYTAWLHLCGQHGVKLATQSRCLDPAQHSDWMLLLMEGGFSSVEMRVLQGRMAEGRREAFRAGKYLSGRPPMPYIYDKQLGGLRVDPEQLETFNQVIKLAESRSIRSIATKLDISLTKIRRLCADDRLLFYTGKRIDPQTSEEIQGQWPPVITDRQAAAIRANRRAGHTNARRTVTGLLARLGIVRCNYCGALIRSWANGNPRKDGTRLSYYGCPTISTRSRCPRSRMIPQSVVDELVVNSLLKTINDPLLRDYWRTNQNSDDNSTQIAATEAEIKKLKEQKSRLIGAITEGVIDFADAKTKRIELDNALNASQQQLSTLQAEPETEPPWDAIALTRDEWAAATIDEQREILEAAIESIKISGDRMLITYRFPRKPTGACIAEIKLPPPGKPGVGQVWK
jgi:DNA invertase Pin-like site-specific DNA recombinase